MKVLENIINPRKYNFEYSAKDDFENASKKNDIINIIPSGKSRSHSEDHLFKESSKAKNKQSEENIQNNLNEYEYSIFCFILKHYLCANEALISNIADELKINVSNSVI